MELAQGDLFDKIEADVGIGEDVAHFYFSQLISAVGYMHSRLVAHRDIKPENILLSDGDLKLADFGLAVLFGYNGMKKKCQTVCGSPPYMAPEVVPMDGFTGSKTNPYEGDVADVWSCGIVLFVLLVGNTPWDEPTLNSYEFKEFMEKGAVDELWAKIPAVPKSLLLGMLKPVPEERFTLEEVRRHPWFTRRNPHLAPDGRAANPVGLATQMLESLHIDFSMDPLASSQRRLRDHTAMDIDHVERLALTQPEAPLIESNYDWENPAALAANIGISASQPAAMRSHQTLRRTQRDFVLDFADEPALSQFSSTPSVSMTLTQQARRFRDILPEQSMTVFYSFMGFSLLLPLLSEALNRIGIPVPAISPSALAGHEEKPYIQIKTRDSRSCRLVGAISIEMVTRWEEELLEVRFIKMVGDPLEWRRLFKKVAVLCKDAIVKPN